MKAVFTVLSFLIVLAGCTRREESPYLKFGHYKWNVFIRLDTTLIEKVYIDSITGESGHGWQERLISSFIYFDTSKYAVKLSAPVIDTIRQVNPITLEEEIIVRQFDKINYNIDAGKVPAKDFIKFLVRGFIVSDTIFEPTYITINIIDGDYHALAQVSCSVAGYEKYSGPKIRAGNRVILNFWCLDKKGEKESSVGKVLFEII